METILQHAQGLVYALLHLMPSSYQHESLRSVLGLFLEAQGHPLPQPCQTKSASALSRFFNPYEWSTRAVWRTTRHRVLQQIAAHPPRKDSSLKVLIDLTTLEKCGKFGHLSDPTWRLSLVAVISDYFLACPLGLATLSPLGAARLGESECQSNCSTLTSSSMAQTLTSDSKASQAGTWLWV